MLARADTTKAPHSDCTSAETGVCGPVPSSELVGNPIQVSTSVTMFSTVTGREPTIARGSGTGPR